MIGQRQVIAGPPGLTKDEFVGRARLARAAHNKKAQQP
jgi:hypothetical protein